MIQKREIQYMILVSINKKKKQKTVLINKQNGNLTQLNLKLLHFQLSTTWLMHAGGGGGGER